MKKTVLLMILVSVFMLGCAPPSEQPIPGVDADDKLFCSTDDDCICGGIDKDGMCFLGNLEYYEKNVDKSRDCPDFCAGIAGNLVVRCVDSNCMQVFECLTDDDCKEGVCRGNKCVASAECSTDNGCTTGGCSGELCYPASSEPRVSICLYKPEYRCLDMIDCGCVAGKCRWKTTPEYDDCVEKAQEEEAEGPV